MSADLDHAQIGRLRRLLPKLVLSVVFLFLLLEGSVRFLLFSSATSSWSVAQRLRDPARFGSSSSDDLYWYLTWRWKKPREGDYVPPHDPRLGWTWGTVAPGSYVHIGETRLGARRPILLFGDSYSACLTLAEECFQGLLEDSALADDYALLNYGICGYGLDQIWLLLGPVLDRHLEKRPIVVVGLLVNDDLDRIAVSMREWPKPRLRLEDGRLFVPPGEIPAPGLRLAEDPPAPSSWAWALLGASRFGDQSIRGTPAQEAEKQELSRHILRAIVADLRSHEVPFFFLLFHTSECVEESDPPDWRDQVVHEELDQLDAPWYQVRDDIRSRAKTENRPTGDFFFPDGSARFNHFNPEGNRIAFGTLLRGLKEVCGVEEGGSLPLRPWRFDASLDQAGGGVAVFQHFRNEFLAGVDDDSRLVLRSGMAQPTEVRYELGGQALVFRARAWSFDPQGTNPELTLEARVDGEPRWSGSLSAGKAPSPIEIDLTGARTLELIVSSPGGQSSACILLSDPVFEVDTLRGSDLQDLEGR